MALEPYTSADQVRSVLGVSTDELSDLTLGLPIYSQHLAYVLDSVNSSVRTTFLTIEGIDVGSRSAAQVKYYDAVCLYSTYCSALQVGQGLYLAAPKSISDGKAVMSRFSEAPFKQLLDGLQASVNKYLDYLNDAISELAGGSATTTITPNFFGVAGMTDPVTNEAR